MARYDKQMAENLEELDDRELLMFIGMTLAGIRRTTDLLRWVLIVMIAIVAVELIVIMIVTFVSAI